jgi:hypothetical protein
MEEVMIKITSLNKIFLSIFLLISPVFSMEVDCDQVAEPYVKETLGKPALRRSGAEYGSFAGFAQHLHVKGALSEPDSKLFIKPFPITCAKVTFPAEAKELEEAIKNHTERIEIYIPRAGKYLSEQTKVCSLTSDSVGVLKINQLRIQHSIGEGRGYWKNALEALMPFIYSAQNLQQIRLSHRIVEDLIPVIAKNIRIIVDCSCAYSATDTIYPQPCLENIRDATEAILKEKYPDRNILVLKAANTEDLFSKGKFKS